MKAVLDRDIILWVTHRGDTEIGKLPKGVGLERLRWDGSKVVDLADLDEMWVEEKNGAFILHAVEVKGSQLVKMSYADRKNLTKDSDGTIRVKTSTELANEAYREALKAKLNRIRDHEAKLILIKIAQQLGLLSSTLKIDSTEQQKIKTKIEEVMK